MKVGVPQIIFLAVLDFIPSIEAKTSKHTSKKIGISPLRSGVFVSSMGKVAMFEIKIVTTSSDGCNSPICLFPIILSEVQITIYSIIVLTKVTIKKSTAFNKRLLLLF